ncbi:MAG: hypothetical protein ACRDJG_02850 [Actinomycetota bacterium]
MSEASPYFRILEAIQDFEAGEVELGDLVTRLEKLINSFEGVSQETVDRFLAEWGVLEDIYAFALDQGWKRLEREDMDLIEKSLLRLSALAEKEEVGLARGGPSVADL